MRRVGTIWVSIVAVVGTLLGSFTTYLFQRRTALHAESTTRAERLRQDRLLACGEFLAAVTEVRRAVVTAWFRRNDEDEQWRSAMTEADRSGAIAEGKLIRILLLLDDGNVREMAEDLLTYVDTVVRAASNKADLESREATFAAKRLEFAATARTLIG